MSSSNAPRRRFAPVPIETTFQSVRKSKQPETIHIGPSAELTPEASPRSPHSPFSPEFDRETHPHRRFAPQLIETSRRTRRLGDAGPATKPTDKTDITPYTKNIYTTKSRARRRLDSTFEDDHEHVEPPTRRESEDENVKAYLLELAAKEVERQIQEAALAAFPNSHAREGGIAHFYFAEGSESDGASGNESPTTEEPKPVRVRRKSSDLGLSWWHKHMQEHAQHLAHEREATQDEVIFKDDGDTTMLSDVDLDNMDLSLPPDPLWTTSGKVSPVDRQDSMKEDLIPPSHVPVKKPTENEQMVDAPRPMPKIPAPTPFAAAPKIPAQTGFRGFGRPLPNYGLRSDSPQAKKLRKLVSPPMLGKDLVFRQCPSPKFTKLEPTHPFDDDLDAHRDMTGQGGLWHGFCFHNEPTEEHHGLWSPPPGNGLLITPHSPGTPADDSDSHIISEEPSSVFSSSASTESSATSVHRQRSGEAKGLHMLHGLNERLQREKAEAERNEKIAQEFTDEFITQVYNYLSLGYPALAAAYDEELAKISHISIFDLRKNDSKHLAKGHMVEMTLEDTPDEDRCPRWRALKTYIYEWARQHPNLNAMDPPAWGVRERRGSWAI
ncbi:unnamed protein product [Clonostachys rhizophaga]|uniref:Uncharacterized protein n=1 Tax=Clonostachys rhizophaga TaxID=160324 RepID=A0A9N9YF18_9HYPO|nr:unnamed protein product [Clonostachys rhizophaga]